MTSPHLDDDALSALLDDEPDGRLAAHVATCGVCTDRLASFRGARAALRTEDALDELTRRRLIQRALDAYDGTSVAAPARRCRSWARVVTVAAAALVLIGGFGVLATTTRHPNRSVASRADIAHVRNLGDLG